MHIIIIFYALESSRGSNHSIIPVQEVTDQTHETLENQTPASVCASYDEEHDGTGSIPISKPVDSTDTGNLVFQYFIICLLIVSLIDNDRFKINV